jgi:CheY-like chemotaxis protein
MDDLDFDPDFLDAESPLPAIRTPAAVRARALVVERDAELTPVCVQQLERIGLQAVVVWTREDALAALEDGKPLAFVYLRAEVLGLSTAEAVESLRRARPATPFVVGARGIEDVLLVDAVVAAAPFKAEEFQAAFDASLFDGERRRVLLDAAAAVRAADAAELAMLAAMPPVGACSLLPLTA